MEHQYALYDALVSINVPTEKARAVVDAMERDMSDKLATKADLEILVLKIDAKLVSLNHTMTLRLGAMISGAVILLGTLQALLR